MKVGLMFWLVFSYIAFVFLTLAEYLFNERVRGKILLKNIVFSLSFSPIAMIIGLIFCITACEEKHKKHKKESE